MDARTRQEAKHRQPPCKHRLHARSNPHSLPAFSLVEAIIAIAVVAWLLTMSLNAIGSAQRTTGSDLNRRLAQEIAQALLAEIAAQPYEDPVTGLQIGPSAAEAATGNRSLFDDVQDYEGWLASPPQFKDGTLRNCPANWREEVQIIHLNAATLVDSGGAATNVSKIIVQIYDNFGIRAQLSTIRTKGLSDTRGCCLSNGSCVNVTPSECVQRGGTAGAIGSSCFGAVCTGQLGYWPMDEGAGTTAADTNGGNNATLDANTTWAAGKVGTALSMMTSGAAVPNSSTLSITGNFSITAWVYPSSVNNSKMIVQKGSWGGQTINYSLGLVNTDAFFVFDGASARFTAITNAGKVQKNEWTHLAATFDASTGEAHIYVNGTKKFTGTTAQRMQSNSGNLLMGKSDAGLNFEGMIDEVHLFNLVLSQSEINAIVNSSSGGSGILNDLLRGMNLQ